ncbi:MAG TPA: TMEM175 family protein [Coriobacteriia bacterium]
MSEARRAHLEEERGVWAERGDDLTRLLQFSDGVFAIAATLLALEIRIPDFPRTALPQVLLLAIVKLVPRVLVYGLTFLNIAVLWLSHHRAFTHINGYDTPLLWMNAFFLMLVAFVPVASSTLGRYPDNVGAVVFYSGLLLATTLAEMQMWLYSTSKRRLVDDDIDPRIVRYITLRGAFPAVVFLTAIPLSFASTLLAEVLILGIFFVSSILGRVYSPVLAHVVSHPRGKKRAAPGDRPSRSS